MLFGCCRRWICNSFHKLGKPKMELAQLKAEWLDFAKRLYPVGMGITVAPARCIRLIV
jgi:hypothetical protein